MNIKDKLIETAEKIYDLTREGKYDVTFNPFSKKSEKPAGIKISSARDTAQTKKWRAKNR